MLTLYPIARFLLEIIRDDESGWTSAQTISICFIAGVTAMWFLILRRPPGTVFPKAVYLDLLEVELFNLETAVGSQKSAQALDAPGKIKKVSSPQR